MAKKSVVLQPKRWRDTKTVNRVKTANKVQVSKARTVGRVYNLARMVRPPIEAKGNRGSGAEPGKVAIARAEPGEVEEVVRSLVNEERNDDRKEGEVGDEKYDGGYSVHDHSLREGVGLPH